MSFLGCLNQCQICGKIWDYYGTDEVIYASKNLPVERYKLIPNNCPLDCKEKREND